MLFRYSLGAAAIADAIETAVGSVLDEGYRTADLYKPGLTQVSTEAMGRLVMEHL